MFNKCYYTYTYIYINIYKHTHTYISINKFKEERYAVKTTSYISWTNCTCVYDAFMRTFVSTLIYNDEILLIHKIKKNVVSVYVVTCMLCSTQQLIKVKPGDLYTLVRKDIPNISLNKDKQTYRQHEPTMYNCAHEFECLLFL